MLQITAFSPVYNPDGQFQGIFATFISLTDISTFLNKLSISPLGQIFIWETITAALGLEGLEKAKTYSLDAIVLDVSMLDMDSISVFEQLQADPVTLKIPVVLLTARVLDSDRLGFL